MRDDPNAVHLLRLVELVVETIDRDLLEAALHPDRIGAVLDRVTAERDTLRRATASDGAEGYYSDVVDYTSTTRFHG